MLGGINQGDTVYLSTTAQTSEEESIVAKIRNAGKKKRERHQRRKNAPWLTVTLKASAGR